MSEKNQRPSGWQRLFLIACGLIDQVNKDGSIIVDWTFGGGTAMMLQIGHRESHDVDIFLPDPQLLPFLSPETHRFDFAVAPDAYRGDGSRAIKFVFDGLGEIDFIAAPALTSNPARRRDIEGIPTLLETVPEIIAKKIFFRGGYIRPRDIFDIAAAGMTSRLAVIEALGQYPREVEAALSAMARLNPKFVEAAISELMIRGKFKSIVGTALTDALELLREVGGSGVIGRD